MWNFWWIFIGKSVFIIAFEKLNWKCIDLKFYQQLWQQGYAIGKLLQKATCDFHIMEFMDITDYNPRHNHSTNIHTIHISICYTYYYYLSFVCKLIFAATIFFFIFIMQQALHNRRSEEHSTAFWLRCFVDLARWTRAGHRRTKHSRWLRFHI